VLGQPADADAAVTWGAGSAGRIGALDQAGFFPFAGLFSPKERVLDTLARGILATAFPPPSRPCLAGLAG